MKTSKIISAVLLMLFCLPVLPVRADNGATNDPYKAIVKIRTLALNNQNDLAELGFGSGIIISRSGLILTNSHVVEVTSSFDNSDMDTAYAVCLPNDTVNEPDCAYTARFVAKDADFDVALLQIENIPGLSAAAEYPYLELSHNDAINVNDRITAIGYPDIGGSTVTSTQGIISGKTEKYGKQWIKTDAIISFGSSGGAALNAANKVIGITTAGHSDLLGSLGYIINIASVDDWISAHSSDSLKSAPLTARAISLVKKQRTMNESNLFEGINPKFSITKPDGWEFTYDSESQLSVTDPADEDGGGISIVLAKQPYKADINSLIPYFRQISVTEGDYSIFRIIEDTNVTINKQPAKRLKIKDKDGEHSLYALPMNNYIAIIFFGYGQDDKDKAAIESMLQTISFKQVSTPEVKKLTNKKPAFSLTVDRDWVVMEKNSQSDPFLLLNKKNRDVSITFHVTKMNDEIKRLNNEAILKRYKDALNDITKTGSSIDVAAQLIESNAHAKINSKISDAILEVIALKTPSNKKTIVQQVGYSKKIGTDYLVDISLNTTNPDKKAFAAYRKELERILQGFIITQSPAPKKDSDKDGLNDEDEKKYGTNPNKKDTDGDGFSDFIEIQSGHNPLGPGKLKKK